MSNNKKAVRPDKEIIEVVQKVVRKYRYSNRDAVINITKMIQKYPIVILDNVAEKIIMEGTRIGEEKGMDGYHDYKNKLYRIGETCFFKPFFPKILYRYILPMKMENTGKVISRLAILLYIDNDSKSGFMLFKPYGFDKRADDIIAGIIPIKFKPIEGDDNPNDRMYSVDVNEDLVRPGTNDCSYSRSITLLHMISNALGEHPGKMFSGLVHTAIHSLGDLHANNYYPFSVGINRCGEGGEIIYLNKIPSHPSKHPAAAEPEGEKAPHMRRGYWWTMRADRYKFHKNYMVENANYRQAAWVGPEQFNYQGKTYKILIHKDEMFTSGE